LVGRSLSAVTLLLASAGCAPIPPPPLPEDPPQLPPSTITFAIGDQKLTVETPDARRTVTDDWEDGISITWRATDIAPARSFGVTPSVLLPNADWEVLEGGRNCAPS